jgi:hypothetical protein
VKYGYVYVAVGIFILSISLVIPSVYADSWYVGKGLKQGDYFRYNVCVIDYHNCAPLEIDFWVQNQTSNGNSNLQFVAVDGNNTQRGIVTIDRLASDPINWSSNLVDYVDVYQSTIIWLSHFATKDSPKDLSYPSWDPLGSIRVPHMVLLGQERITVKAGSYNATVIHTPKGADNGFWIVPELPFPVKGVIINPYLGRPGSQLVGDFELLETGNSKVTPKFVTSGKSQYNFSHLAFADPVSDTYKLNYKNNVYDIPYTISNGTFKSMFKETSIIEITIDPISNGSLTVSIPRELIDPIDFGGRVQIIQGGMLLWHKDIDFNCDYRKIMMNFTTAGSKTITFGSDIMVPENYGADLDIEHVQLANMQFDVPIHSQGAICSLNVNPEDKKVSMIMKGVKGTTDHIEVDNIRNFLTGNYTVLANNNPINSTIAGNTIKFNLDFPTNERKIDIIGTQMIPEFPFAIPILLVSITSVIVFYGIKIRK